MTIQSSIHYNNSYPRRTWPVLLLMLVAMMATACIMPSAVTQTFSPLNPGITSRLVGKRWEMVEVTFRNESIPIDEIKPVEIWFDQAGTMNFNSAKCTAGAYLIFFADERHYQLARGDVSAVGCKELPDRQMARMLEVLKATTAYEIRENQLFLTGADVRILLEIANTH